MVAFHVSFTSCDAAMDAMRLDGAVGTIGNTLKVNASELTDPPLVRLAVKKLPAKSASAVSGSMSTRNTRGPLKTSDVSPLTMGTRSPCRVWRVSFSDGEKSAFQVPESLAD